MAGYPLHPTNTPLRFAFGEGEATATVSEGGRGAEVCPFGYVLHTGTVQNTCLLRPRFDSEAMYLKHGGVAKRYGARFCTQFYTRGLLMNHTYADLMACNQQTCDPIACLSGVPLSNHLAP